MPSVTHSDPLGNLCCCVDSCSTDHLLTSQIILCSAVTGRKSRLGNLASHSLELAKLAHDSFGRPCFLRRYACSSQTLSEHAGGLYNADKRTRRPGGSSERYGTGIFSPVKTTRTAFQTYFACSRIRALIRLFSVQTGRQSLKVLAEQQQAWEHVLKVDKVGFAWQGTQPLYTICTLAMTSHM